MASEGQKSESCGAPQIAVLFTYFREQNLTWAIGISYPGPHSVPYKKTRSAAPEYKY